MAKSGKKYQDLIEDWLEKKTANDAMINLLMCAGALILAVVVAEVTKVCLEITFSILQLMNFGYDPVFSYIFIAALFVCAWLLQKPRMSEAIVFKRTESGSKEFRFEYPAPKREINPSEMGIIRLALWMIGEILLASPNLVFFAIRLISGARRLKRLDRTSCGKLLVYVVFEGRRVAFQEISDSVSGIDIEVTVNQLADIRGVMFLGIEPPSMMLSEKLSDEILTALER
ncbi:MAG: hypothetical protein NUW37_16400 [Planctomycetes bacterium]|nr:hypothetical protein [Planctomycetota bacterium]